MFIHTHDDEKKKDTNGEENKADPGNDHTDASVLPLPGDSDVIPPQQL
jgi:hypothetical protein